MSLIEIATSAMRDTISVYDLKDKVIINTQCLYPSGGSVRVIVRGGINAFVVSDEGGAMQELSEAGADLRNAEQAIRHLLPDILQIRGGNIQTGEAVSKEWLPAAIITVANTSKEVAEYMFERYEIKRDRNFKRLVADLLKRQFDDRLKHNETIVGYSNTPHKFENVIELPRNRRLIVDAVLHDASSINARVVANMDVKQAQRPGLEQRIIYDDEENWTAANLALLSVGATVVPYSRSEAALQRLMAA